MTSLFRMSLVTGIALAGALSGCVTPPQSLYYWGDYQKQVYRHFTKEIGPQEQIIELEAGLERARASGKPVPPGYAAHLGILYAQNEHHDKMQEYFETERKQYPESASYIDFLLRNFKTPEKGAGK
jgi:hypothetical protein